MVKQGQDDLRLVKWGDSLKCTHVYFWERPGEGFPAIELELRYIFVLFDLQCFFFVSFINVMFLCPTKTVLHPDKR